MNACVGKWVIGNAAIEEGKRVRCGTFNAYNTRHGIRKGALEGNHGRPIDGRLRFEPFALQVAGPVRTLSHRNQHLLGIAPAQRAGSTVGQVVDHGYLPARRCGHARDARTARASADHDQVEVLTLVHVLLLDAQPG